MGGVSGAGFGSIASPQQPERSPPTQPQNPYRSPTITNPYSPEDRRQFGFQIPHQLQMNQQRQQYQPPDPDMSYTGGSRDFYRDRGGFGGDPRSDVGTMGMQPQQQQFQQQTNTDLLRRLGNPMPGTPEHRLRYPEIGTPEFEQLHGPGANAEAQRPRESGPITTMPIGQLMGGRQATQQQRSPFNPYMQQLPSGFGGLLGGSMGAILNRSRQGPGPGQYGYGDGPGGAPQMSQQQQQMLRGRVGQSQQTQQLNPYMQQQRPNPYQMYGGLGSLFNMQDAYSQRPAPITQAQSNEANRKIQEKYKNPAQQTAQQAAQQYDFNPISINNVG